MSYYASDMDSFRCISHHGILGQKWGVRRYQNKDGTRTELGKKHRSDIKDLPTQKQTDAEFERIRNLPRKSKTDISKKALEEERFLKRAALAQDPSWRTARKYYLKTSGNYNNGSSITKAHADALKELKLAREEFSKIESEAWNQHYRKHEEGYWMPKSINDRIAYNEKVGQAAVRSITASRKFAEVVLKDMGLENTEANRNYIRYIYNEDED